MNRHTEKDFKEAVSLFANEEDITLKLMGHYGIKTRKSLRELARRFGVNLPKGPYYSRRVSDDVVAKILNLNKEGFNKLEIASEVNLHPRTVLRILMEINGRSRKKQSDYTPEEWHIRTNISHARHKYPDSNLEIDDLIPLPLYCPVLGIKLEYKKGKGKGNYTYNSPTLDRIDSSKGYTKENVKIISWRANRLKYDGTLKEFEDIVAYIKNNFLVAYGIILLWLA